MPFQRFNVGSAKAFRKKKGRAFVALLGYLYAWGNAGNGGLGTGNTINRSSPVQVGALSNWATITAGTTFALAIKTDGTMWSWGSNIYGQCGLGNTTYYSSPKQVGALTNWAFIVGANGRCHAIKTDGTLWAWGNGNAGGSGLGNTISYSSPKQVCALTNGSPVSDVQYQSYRPGRCAIHQRQ